jgi:hypothetical protein
MGRVDGVAGDSENIGEFVTDCVSSGSRGMSLREALAKKEAQACGLRLGIPERVKIGLDGRVGNGRRGSRILSDNARSVCIEEVDAGLIQRRRGCGDRIADVDYRFSVGEGVAALRSDIASASWSQDAVKQVSGRAGRGCAVRWAEVR